MTEPTNPAVLGLVKLCLEVERKAEVAYIADYQAYLESDEDTPLPATGAPGPLSVRATAASDALQEVYPLVLALCQKAGAGEAWDLWTARVPVREATDKAWEALTNERLDGRIDYKARQVPALPLTPEEYARQHWLAHPALEPEPVAEASSDTAATAPATPGTPATTPA